MTHEPITDDMPESPKTTSWITERFVRRRRSVLPARETMTENRDSPVSTGVKSGKKLAILLMMGAVLGKGLGFVREIMMAHLFGASIVADGFRAATTGTLLPLALFQNESVPAILIPTHKGWQETGDAPRRFAALAVALTLISALIAVMVVVFGATWVRALVGGFSPDAQVMTLDLMRVMALGMPASVMINVLASGEIAIGKSRLATIRSSLLNTSVIIGLVFVYLTHQWMALAWSFAIAFNTLSLWGLWTMIRDGSIDFGGLTIADVIDAAQDFWRKLIPFLFVPLADQGNLWVERVLASRASVGSVASLDYARTITDSAVLFISQPLGLALLSVADSEDQRERIEVVIRRLLVAAIPACAMLALFAPDLARLVFARGAFNDTAVQMTGETLRGISIGLWASTIGWIVLRLLNKVGRNKMAALLLVLAYVSNLVFNFIAFHVTVLASHGTLLLGIGESVRGLVLLGGAVFCLGLIRSTIISIIYAVFPTIIILVLGMYIQSTFTGSLVRIGLSGIAFGVVIGGAMLLLFPEIFKTWLRRVRHKTITLTNDR